MVWCRDVRDAYIRVHHCFCAVSEMAPGTVHRFEALLTTVLVCCKHLRDMHRREEENLSEVQRYDEWQGS